MSKKHSHTPNNQRHSKFSSGLGQRSQKIDESLPWDLIPPEGNQNETQENENTRPQISENRPSGEKGR